MLSPVAEPEPVPEQSNNMHNGRLIYRHYANTSLAARVLFSKKRKRKIDHSHDLPSRSLVYLIGSFETSSLQGN